jgi:hypothetical protein
METQNTYASPSAFCNADEGLIYNYSLHASSPTTISPDPCGQGLADFATPKIIG